MIMEVNRVSISGTSRSSWYNAILGRKKSKEGLERTIISSRSNVTETSVTSRALLSRYASRTYYNSRRKSYGT
jgi:hypothetical protein